jgi:hypothetical protein
MTAIAAGGASVAAEGTAQAAAMKTSAGASAVKIAGAGKVAASISTGAAWKVVVGVVVVSALGGGTVLQQARSDNPAPPRARSSVSMQIRGAAPREMPRAALPKQAPPPLAEILAPEPPLPVEPPAQAYAAPSVRRAPTTAPVASSSAAVEPPRAVPREDTLEAETRRLREAHGALQNGDPGRALALLEAQSIDFAEGKLAEERAAARVLALGKLGRAAEASAEAERFLRENPRSPLADRVRAACAAPR